MGAQNSSSSRKTSRVVKFHSYQEWQTHVESSKGSNNMVVMEIGTAWCGQCKRLEPVFKRFALKYTDVDFIKIDADELGDVAREYRVDRYPTFIMLKNGKEVDRIEGADEYALQKKIRKYCG